VVFGECSFYVVLFHFVHVSIQEQSCHVVTFVLVRCGLSCLVSVVIAALGVLLLLLCVCPSQVSSLSCSVVLDGVLILFLVVVAFSWCVTAFGCYVLMFWF
jgi:hypothetical protein